ncbi:MAG TPA: NAD-dependent epimerase/dehydratase family protein [Candidatus Methanoperedens sp.]|nr:NAD-dependent epimerase/dehydratase family protein [Candidatus Methanoperedens sp.]
MNQERKNILVLGASGGVGGMVLRGLQDTHQFNLTGTYFQHQKNGLIYCDIRNPENVNKVIESSSPSAIINFSGLAQEKLCQDKPELAYETNVMGTENLIKAASKYSIPLLYPGTINELSGYQDGTICTEDTKPLAKDTSIYGKTKIIARQKVLERCTSPTAIPVTDLVLGSGFGFVALGENNGYFRIRIDATRFPIYIEDYLKYIQLFIRDPQKYNGVYHLFSEDFQQGILLSDLAKKVTTRFALASEYQVIEGATEFKPRDNVKAPIPIYIDADAKKLATENRVFTSTRH